MNISIQSIHFDADRKLIDFIKKKLEKLDNIHQGIVNTEVYLRLDKAETKANKITELKVQIPGNTLYASEQCNTFEESTDLVVESMRKQLAKAKEKIKA